MSDRHVPLSTQDSNQAVAEFGAAPRTRAVPVVGHDADRQVWLAKRRDGIGASEVACVLGVSPYASLFALYYEKRLGWTRESTREMAVGLLLEPLIAQLFGEDRPDLAVFRPDARTYAHPDYPWMFASPDFLAVTALDAGWRDERTGLMSGPPPEVVLEPVECKSDDGGHGWGRPGTGDVPEHHRWQVWQQCEVLGATRGHLVRMRGKKLTAYVVPYGPAERAEFERVAVPACRRFLVDVEMGNAPEPDGHVSTERALMRLYPEVAEADGEPLVTYVADELADRFDAAHAALTSATAAYQLVRNQLRHRMGTAGVALRVSDSTRVATRRRYKRSGYDVLPAMVDELRKATRP